MTRAITKDLSNQDVTPYFMPKHFILCIKSKLYSWYLCVFVCAEVDHHIRWLRCQNSIQDL